jgi:hypothetical protein
VRVWSSIGNLLLVVCHYVAPARADRIPHRTVDGRAAIEAESRAPIADRSPGLGVDSRVAAARDRGPQTSREIPVEPGKNREIFLLLARNSIQYQIVDENLSTENRDLFSPNREFFSPNREFTGIAPV